MAASAEAPIVARWLVVLAELAFRRSPAPTAPRADRTPAAAVAAGPAAAQAAKAAVALVGRAAPEARLEHRMDRRAGTAAGVVAEAVVAAATTETVPARRASPTRLRLLAAPAVLAATARAAPQAAAAGAAAVDLASSLPELWRARTPARSPAAMVAQAVPALAR